MLLVTRLYHNFVHKTTIFQRDFRKNYNIEKNNRYDRMGLMIKYIGSCEMKKLKRVLLSFLIIFVISLISELLNIYLPFPIPASVYGVVLLFFGLTMKVIRLEWVESGADILIMIMPLLFVPSVVKLVTLKSLIIDNIFPLLTIIVISSIVIMVVTGKVSQWLIERKDK